MAVVLNGVLVSREAGCLMPSSPLDTVKLSNCTINSLKIDSGDKKITEAATTDIVPNPSNLPIIHNGAWSLETEFYASFNGDLEAGPLSFQGKPIDSIAIRRSSNRSNFFKWEDIKVVRNIKNVVDKDNSYSFSDKTVESGLWYTYAIQPISQQERGSLYKSNNVNAIYEDAFLVGEGGRQLKLKYNLVVSNIKRNIKETRVETIGSKYPFVVRNADVDYNEFGLSGLITHFMDETKEFAPRAEMFVDDEFSDDVLVDMTQDYSDLYSSLDINEYNNTTLEREFRDKVHEFLTDGKPKLFKSPKVGCFIVRLMDVAITPKPEINGGMVCDFSCNAIEIDDLTIDNFEKYQIQNR